MKLRLLWTLAVAMLGMGIAAPASAQNVSAKNPASIAEVIKGKGFTTEITKDDGGDPMIKADGNGVKFIVLFYGCTANKDCTTISFYAGWSGSKADANKINEWNSGQRFGRAYIDKEGDPAIEMDVDLDDGGMSKLLFEDNVEFWMSVMSAYSKFIYE